MVNFDSEEGFTIHMKQHAKDDAKEGKAFKPYKPPPAGKKRKK